MIQLTVFEPHSETKSLLNQISYLYRTRAVTFERQKQESVVSTIFHLSIQIYLNLYSIDLGFFNTEFGAPL